MPRTTVRGHPMTAYERVLDRLRELGKTVRIGSNGGSGQAIAQCPSHEDRKASLAIYNKPGQGKAKVVCFAGCSDALDVLPAIGMTVADLYNQHGPRTPYQPPTEVQARIEARVHDATSAGRG
jgi:hypothetical protein